MRLVDAAAPVFARHETFHPRYGWFRKAFDAACENSAAFTDPNATVELGVGKNMVKAIRFWGLAAKLIQDDPDSPNQRSPGVVPTTFGKLLFDPEGGWDRYMEDPGTLWLLHWKLLSPRCVLPVWWATFNEFHAVEFDAAELELACAGGIAVAAEWQAPHHSSLKKDVTALLRTYAPADRSARSSIDDLLDCPLRELGLIARSQATGRYRFAMGAKPTLPSAIAAYAVLDYIACRDPKASTVLLSRIADEPGAPGRAFRLSESELADALRPAAESLSGGKLALASPAGAAQLGWKGSPRRLADKILAAYYFADLDTARAQMDAGLVGAVMAR
ncbi:DUF4007 family protein [Candidatus Poriferisocius sp.]|uniref:DUF4007 family protein n=1 Tax=Candidatus Poriferisocius sp. TaxID=3101276 RepID=UPI003B018430